MASTSSSTVNAVQDGKINSVCAVNASNFVSAKLQLGVVSNNYMAWKEQMLCLIESEDLLGFIDGEVVPPPSPENGKTKSKDYVAWRRKDRLVKGWILGAVSEELVRKCVGFDTARNVWIRLEQLSRLPPPPPPPPPPFHQFVFGKGSSEYLKLYQAAVRCHRTEVRQIMSPGHNMDPVRIAYIIGTVLHAAARTRMTSHDMEQLLDIIPCDILQLQTWNEGNTLHIAASTGNTDVAKFLIKKFPALLNQPTRDEGLYPIHLAARSAHKETLKLLMSHKGTLELLMSHKPNPAHAGSSGDSKPNPANVGSSGDSKLNSAYTGSSGDSKLNPSYAGSSGDSKLNPPYAGSSGDSKPNPAYIGSNDDSKPKSTYASSTSDSKPNPAYAGSSGDSKPNPAYTGSSGDSKPNPANTSSSGDSKPKSTYAGSSGILLLCNIIDADFYDIALCLVDKYRYLVTMKHESGKSALERLSRRVSAFPSGARFNLYETLVYSCIVRLERTSETSDNNAAPGDVGNESKATPQQTSDIESAPGHVGKETEARPPSNPTGLRKWYKILVQKLQFSLVLAIDTLVPYGRKIHDDKLMHEQAKKLLKCLCQNMLLMNEKESKSIYNSAMMTAARLGNPEVVQEIIKTFPLAIYAMLDGRYFFQVAAENRSDNVFILMINRYSELRDTSGNTVLHLVAKLAPPDKLNLVSGAALQMQRELQWFKGVYKSVHPYVRESVNKHGKTPWMIFTEEHKSLKEKGEKWMKDTASSCIIAASLIATVVFATGITVPGGNNSNGFPMFRTSTAFIIFAISDVISLFTSITSLLMFLSIMTSRYAEGDFMYSLPKRLSIGLITLFISIYFMMVAFSAATYLVLGQEQKWVLISVATLACLPIFSFGLLQFPLLVDVVLSTYRFDTFLKKIQHS